jgi:hypothetical protein
VQTGFIDIPGVLVNRGPGSIEADRMYNASIDAWADPVTGAIVKGRKHVRQWAEDNGELLMPLADLTLTYNPQTIAKLTTDAKDAGKQLELVSKTLPIVLPIVGLIFAGLGVLLLRPEKGAEPKAVPPADSKDAKKDEDSAAVEESVAAEPQRLGNRRQARNRRKRNRPKLNRRRPRNRRQARNPANRRRVGTRRTRRRRSRR